MYQQLKDTFNAFDKDGNGELGYPEYNDAWKILGQPGDDTKIKAALDGVDIDQSRLVEWSEFVFSIMGEAATKYSVLADMEDLERLLKNTVSEYKILRDTLQEVRANNDVRAERNNRLRQRLGGMKDEVGAQMNGLFASMTGVRPEDVLSEAEIDAHLKTAFDKFESSGDGQLGEWELTQCWVFLGLKVGENEIKSIFKSVDTNNSGFIDFSEFKQAIKGERMMELSPTRVLNKMGVKYFDAQDQYEVLKKTAALRRLMWEENPRFLSRELIDKLSSISNENVPKRDEKKEKMYNTLRDTFDKDGSAELGYPEYVEAWKFLNRPRTEKDIKRTFDSVDVDGSGFVEWNEFAFSLMGEDGLIFGALADMDEMRFESATSL